MGKESRRGLQQRGPSVLAVGPDAHNTHRQGEARARMGTQERRKKKKREKELSFFPSFTIGTIERIAETRKTSHTKNALLPGSLESFSKRGAKLAPFSGFFRGEEERALDGGQGSFFPFLPLPILFSCPSYVTFFVALWDKALSRSSVVVPSDFPRYRGSTSTQKENGEIYLFSLCLEESSIRANRTEKIDENNTRVRRN